MDVLHLNKASLEKLQAEHGKNIIIDFWATWCGPCMMMGPVLEEIAAERPDLVIGKINVDDERDLAISFGIDTIPCFILIRDGAEQKRVIGAMKKEQLLARLGL